MINKEHSDETQAALDHALSQMSWVNEKLQGVALVGDHRHRIPAQLFDLAIEHGAGILSLIKARICASAFALVRSQFECFVRAAWLHHCATDAEIDKFVEKDRIDPNFTALIEAIESKPEFETKLLSTVKDSAWNAMNGYTHGGIHQVSRRMDGEFIEPCFETEALIEVTNFSATMALIAFGQIAAMAGRDDLVEEARLLLG